MDIDIQAQPLDPALPALTLGEGPHWDADRQVLYCVDIIGRKVHRFDPATREHTTCETPSMVGFAVLEEGSADNLVVGLQDGIYRLNFNTGHCDLLVKPPAMPSCNRFNDAKTDPGGGRLWAGTMNLEPDPGHPTGSLYRLDANGLAEIETGIVISNGLGWTADGRRMFYTDTLRDDSIHVFDYDPATGTAGNGRPFVAGRQGTGHHDGLAVDMNGRVFTAKWGGSAVEVYTPDGVMAGRISVPAPQVSNCAFGGPDMKTLFITTARDGLSDAELKEAPLSGHIFTARLDVAGVPVPRYRHAA